MKVYGTLDLQNNFISNLALNVETDFPAIAPEGRLVFKNNILYISVMVEGNVSWIPLTNELQTLVYTNGFASTSWVIDHNYNTYSIMVQVYDTDKKIIIPGDVQMTTLNQVTITFAEAQAGSAVIISKRDA